MLVEFSVENFRSIKEKVTLSMVASGYKGLEENVISQEKTANLRLLKSAVIYGANASGKSNLIMAMNFMINLVKKSHKLQQGDEIEVSPFKFDRESRKPSSFEVAFIHNKKKYVYGFSCTEQEIIHEYLYEYPKGRRSILFERENGKFKFTKDVKTQKEISKRTASNALYLSVASQWNYELIGEIFKWFTNTYVMSPSSPESVFAYTPLLEMIGFSSIAYEDTIRLLEKENIKKSIIKFMKKADISIDNIEIEKPELGEGNPRSKNIFNFLGQMPEIKFIHSSKTSNGEKLQIEFDLSEESDGTKKLLRILAPWVDSLQNGKIMIADELDLRLHPLLTEMIVKMFHSNKHNKKDSQLIFTTHNTYLMRADFFRKDQIWFTEKTERQNTELYSLYDVKGVRKNENIEKGYLLGRYGGTPLIDAGDIDL